MASSKPFILFITYILITISTLCLQVCNASFFVLPIIKDSKQSQYYTTFLVGTRPSTRVNLVIDLANRWSWFSCDLVGYKNSTTSRTIRCNTPKWDRYAGPLTFCSGANCGAYAYTPWSNGLYAESLREDTATLYKQSSLLAQPSKVVLPSFAFSCPGKGPLKGLSPYTKGVVTLSRVPVSLHSQISTTFKVAPKFSICLPSSTSTKSDNFNGAIYFGISPFSNHNNIISTPLIVNPNSTAPISLVGDASVEYFIKVTSIEVQGMRARFKSSLLSFDKDGVGGTKLSTMDPYTVLHSDIYKALVNVFVAKAAAMKITRVAPVAPFGACFKAESVTVDAKTGPRVPIIDIILHNNNVKWRIYGANSMVKVSKSVWCLGFVDGGKEPMTSIVIGGKQMEDSLVEFDLKSSRLGVTSSLLRLGTSCSKFKGI